MIMESNKPEIFPLSADPALGETEKNFKIYFNYLMQAFDEHRIHNIAVTGDFGIGKSSLIRAFEKKYILSQDEKNQKPYSKKKAGRDDGFLYISLGNYTDVSSCDKKADECKTKSTASMGNPTISMAGDEEESDEISQIKPDSLEKPQIKSCEKHSDCNVNAVERRILLQIYAHFRQKELPLTSFRMISEKVSGREVKSILISFMICVILLLSFHSQLGELAVALNLSWLVTWKTLFRLILYMVIIGMISVCVGLLVYSVLPRIQVAGLSLKYDKVELEMEKSACESYLDQYSMEIVYCMEQLAGKIYHTVVIEDMDRLDKDTCIEVFTRLRQINILINLRLDRDDCIRFVYVVNNHLLDCLNYAKFFDYVLPVIPVLNSKSAESIFMKNLRQIDASLIKCFQLRNDTELFRRVEDEGTNGIVYRTAPYLLDFRMQYTILNEYSLLFSLYYQNNYEPQKNISGNSRKAEDEAVQILALAIYKNFWPEDYGRIHENKSKVIPICNIDELKEWNNYELLKVLVNPDNHFLSARCLHYVGYSEADLVDSFQSMLEDDKHDLDFKVRRIDVIEKDDDLCIVALRNYGKNLNLSGNSDNAIKMFQTVIRCMVRCGIKDNDWFFDGRDVMECLAILETLGDELLREFMDLCGADGSVDLFKNCLRRNALENTEAWSMRQVDVFCCGVPNCADGISGVNIKVRDENGKDMALELYPKIKHYWESIRR